MRYMQYIYIYTAIDFDRFLNVFNYGCFTDFHLVFFFQTLSIAFFYSYSCFGYTFCEMELKHLIDFDSFRELIFLHNNNSNS